ncbi:MAG: hypothetical protein ACLFQB_10710 [Chitinispirillaceae bacterium]
MGPGFDSLMVLLGCVQKFNRKTKAKTPLHVSYPVDMDDLPDDAAQKDQITFSQ